MDKDMLAVRGVRWFGTGIFEMELEREGLLFTPGDCVALFAADGRVSRPYSIASGTDDDSLRFIIRRMPGGAVSEYLSQLKPGNHVRASPPFGWFRPGEHGGSRPFAFIATGTGIAPFLSHLRSRPTVHPSIVLYGVRELADAVDVDGLKKVCNLRLAVSRQQVSGTHHGRVTDLLGEVPVDANTDYYLCGLDVMIDDVTNWLEARGIDITRIHRECFFNASFTA
jgi:ferredoxin-NADP reductase